MYRALWNRVPTPVREKGPDGRNSHTLIVVSLQLDWNSPTIMGLIREWSFGIGQSSGQGHPWPDPMIDTIGRISNIDHLRVNGDAWETVTRWKPINPMRPRSSAALARGQATMVQYDPTAAIQATLRYVHSPPAWLADVLGNSDRLIVDGYGVGRVASVSTRGSMVVSARYMKAERIWPAGRATDAMSWVELSSRLGHPATDYDLADNVAAVKQVREGIEKLGTALAQSHPRAQLRTLGVPEDQVEKLTAIDAVFPDDGGMSVEDVLDTATRIADGDVDLYGNEIPHDSDERTL